MCKLCDRATRRRNENKYFGYDQHRWLKFFGSEVWWKLRGRNPFKFHKGCYMRKASENSHRGHKVVGYLRKANGIFGLNRGE